MDFLFLHLFHNKGMVLSTDPDNLHTKVLAAIEEWLVDPTLQSLPDMMQWLDSIQLKLRSSSETPSLAFIDDIAVDIWNKSVKTANGPHKQSLVNFIANGNVSFHFAFPVCIDPRTTNDR